VAHGVTKSSEFQLHQMLHGYADGHRLIASSTTLPPADLRLMLQLSDSAGLGARIPDAGYLTGYPLTNARFFVVARTWAAPSMPRPGCVWTHSLLIAFEDLAQIEALEAIDGLFRRPYGTTQTMFDEPIAFQPKPQPCTWARNELEFLRRIVSGLYMAPTSTIAAQPPDDVRREDIVMRIWNQQWPRLRRGFRFSTFTVEDRSLEGSPFDLQLLANGLLPRPRLRNMLDVDAKATVEILASWVDTAVADLTEGGNGLRAFLRQFGGELPGGRNAFVLLCDLYERVVVSTDSAAVQNAMAIIDAHAAESQLQPLRRLIVHRALTAIDWRSAPSLDFIIRHRVLIAPGAWNEVRSQLGLALLRVNPAVFIDIGSETANDEALFAAALAQADEETLVSAIDRAPALANRIFAQCPSLLKSDLLWRSGSSFDCNVIRELHLGPDMAASIVKAAIEAGRADQAVNLRATLGPLVILEAIALAARAGVQSPTTRNWLIGVSKDADALLSFLSSSVHRSLDVLDRIAESCGPGPSLRSFDSGWLDAFSFAYTAEPRKPRLALASVVMAKMLKAGASNAVERAVPAIAPVYSAIVDLTLPETCWNWIEPHLGWPSFWRSQSRLERLVQALAERIAEERLPLNVLLTVMPQLNAEAHLLRCLCESAQGRRYIRSVLTELVDLPAELMERGHLLGALLKDHGD
jgi:hypothetical protein